MIAALAGLLAGSVHVWSGPDHLAAVAPLAVRVKGRPWLSGFRWGLGHSAGVGLVGLASLALRGVLPVEALSNGSERLVGVVLIGIGLWGLRNALRTRVHAHAHTHDGTDHVHVHAHKSPARHEEPAAHVHLHAALGVGMLHGVAGSSHFLGVLPALAFPTTAEAVAYICAYGVGTIASMAAFSSLVGHVARRPAFDGAAAQRWLMATCSVGALGIGCYWLVA